MEGQDRLPQVVLGPGVTAGHRDSDQGSEAAQQRGCGAEPEEQPGRALREVRSRGAAML